MDCDEDDDVSLEKVLIEEGTGRVLLNRKEMMASKRGRRKKGKRKRGKWVKIGNRYFEKKEGVLFKQGFPFQKCGK